MIALNGEAEANRPIRLAPGLHFWTLALRHRIKVPVAIVPQGEIALVLAADGAAIPSERLLGKIVESDNFQDARKFLLNGGEKGRQLGILTAGTYRINTAQFNVITGVLASEHGMAPAHLQLQQVESDRVGIVTTMDGRPIEAGEIAGPVIPAHENFQNAQAFLDGGGRRGLQEQVLLSGTWNLNPWFAQVEQVPMVQIPIGYVGVVISFVGMAHEDVSGLEFKHGDLVAVGHKGVWVTPLYPGKHPINTRVAKVELVPTTNIVLNWAARIEAHKYDQIVVHRCVPRTIRFQPGCVADHPRRRGGRAQGDLARRVDAEPGRSRPATDWKLLPGQLGAGLHSARFPERAQPAPVEAAGHIRTALAAYDVQAIDTLIGDIHPPAELMHTQTDRKIAEEQRKTC